ncbi:hypothetical protein BC629DRAFT_1435016 [Irpex lacteus]|nr:hypothetical protein BC629DRAFT_1435016 [Irpex lacteus]
MLFKHIATFATFALSAVSVFAAPAVDTDATALAKRAQPKSLAQIFTAATSAVTPFTQQLKALGPSDLTTAKMQPIVNNINGVLNNVVTEVKALKGQPASVVLADNANTAASRDVHPNLLLTVAAVAQLIAALLVVVLEALGTVAALLSANPVAVAVELNLLLVGVGQLLGTVVATVVAVVGDLLPGLVGLLAGLLGGVAGIIGSLGLSLLGGLLGFL